MAPARRAKSAGEEPIKFGETSRSGPLWDSWKPLAPHAPAVDLGDSQPNVDAEDEAPLSAAPSSRPRRKSILTEAVRAKGKAGGTATGTSCTMTCAGVATPSQSPDGSTTKPLSIDGQNGDANTLAAAPRAAVDGGGAAAVATIAAALGSAADTSEQDMLLNDAFAKVKHPEEPPTTQLEEAFRAALSEAHIDVRSAVGQRFQREHRPGTPGHEALKAARGHEAKAAFRREWAEGKYEELRKTRTYKESYCRVDVTQGSYLSLSRIIAKEGGANPTLADVAAAHRHVAKCVVMAGPWVRYNPMAERIDFLYMEFKSQDTLERCWSRYEEHHTGGALALEGTAVAASSDASPAAKAAPTAAAAGEDKHVEGTLKKRSTVRSAGRSGAVATAASPREEGLDPKTKKVRKEIDVLFNKAMRVKEVYHKTVGNARSMLRNIRESAAWSWANTAETIEALEGPLKHLEQLPEFHANLLAREGKDIKAEHTEAALHVQLVAFLEIEGTVSSLALSIKKLNAMHSQAMKF